MDRTNSCYLAFLITMFTPDSPEDIPINKSGKTQKSRLNDAKLRYNSISELTCTV
jgi:hypothetical protein